MKNSEYKLYFDLDGVLVDFDNGYKKSSGYNYNDLYNKYGHRNADVLYYKWVIDFWADLDWIHGGQELWNTAKNLYENIYILSSAGLVSPIKFKLAEMGKKKWVRKNMPEMPQENVFIVNGKRFKQTYADKRSILVDDMPITIQQWNMKGGYGILHKSSHYKNTIEDLEDISKPVKIGELARRFFWKT